MKTFKKEYYFKTKAKQDIFDLSRQVEETLRESGVKEGLLIAFVPGSTAGITTIEFESGVLSDIREVMERLAPADKDYAHNARWGDGNGFSHVRAALVGPSLSIPVSGGRLVLGTWQQPILMDFDNKPRNREVVITVIGE
ncbi:MAG: secondary thiamine-phosphate synthase enzyme YjbQ [Myxococcota bacterium]